MTQTTTWHASGATDAPPQVSGGNTEASATRKSTPLHPSTNPDLGKAAPKIDPDRMVINRGALLERIEELLSSFQGSPNESIAYQELTEWLRKQSAHVFFSMPDYGATQLQEEGISPGATGSIADFELRELQTAVDAGPKRVELRASQEFVDTLDSLAQETKLSRAHVIRRAIALYARAILEKSQGNVIGIAALENNQIKLKEILQV